MGEKICVPNSEILRKAIFLNLSEHQFAEYLIFLDERKEIGNGISREIAFSFAKRIFRPTEEELSNDNEYLSEVIRKGFPQDYQNYLSETLFSMVDDFLVSAGNNCSKATII